MSTVTSGTVQYGTGNPSAVDKAAGNNQIRQEHFDRKAILELKDEMYFSKLSGYMGIPKNTGKEIVKHRWLPILDDENVSNPISTDIALGVDTDTGNIYGSSRGMGFIRSKYPTIEENTARGNAISVSRKEVRSGIANYGLMHEWTKDEYNFDSDPKLKMHTTREILRATNQINEDMLADELINGAGIVYSAGTDAMNVDSSVKYVNGGTYDAGDVVYTGTVDVDARYYKVLVDRHPSDETEEYVAAIDENSNDTNYGYIIDDAGLASIDAFSGINFTAVPSIEDLYRIAAELDHNKCPVDTKIIDGSLKTDTKTVQNARYMFISPDMKMAFMRIKKLNGVEDAFIPVEQYAAANTNKKYIQSINGEIGQVGPFRIVVHPKMVKYSDTNDNDVGTAVGAAKSIYINNNTKELTDDSGAATDDDYSYYCQNTDYISDGTNYAVYPCVVIGSDAYTHLGFEGMAGTAQKFKVKHKMPEELITRDNAFGKFGLTTVEWWSGVLIERPEWIAVYNCVARY